MRSRQRLLHARHFTGMAPWRLSWPAAGLRCVAVTEVVLPIKLLPPAPARPCRVQRGTLWPCQGGRAGSRPWRVWPERGPALAPEPATRRRSRPGGGCRPGPQLEKPGLKGKSSGPTTCCSTDASWRVAARLRLRSGAHPLPSGIGSWPQPVPEGAITWPSAADRCQTQRVEPSPPCIPLAWDGGGHAAIPTAFCGSKARNGTPCRRTPADTENRVRCISVG